MPTDSARVAGREKEKQLVCAIYTRKSTDENLNSGFTSLDSQREYCQAFIKSREGEGWRLYPEDYTDPGFSGGNINRPALRKLLSDARQGKFQAVVCYKYDRLSRNTKDFLHILDTFDRNGVAFVSVTQPIDTTSSVGRLMRSILVDFSQFEREMISERTRDKMAAMARRGKRTGGSPIIGFDIDRDNKRLRINPAEADQVREMFDSYQLTKSLSKTAKILNEKGYCMKAWVTRKNQARGGQKFNKASLWYLLQNPLYIGKITYRKEVMPGEHEAIIPEDLFQSVQKLLRGNGHGKVNKQVVERTHAYLLRGLVECACCKTTMTPSSALPRKKGKIYGRFYYYKCLSVVKMDKTACQVRSVSAKSLEEFVVKRLELLGENKEVVERIVRQSQEATGQELPLKRDERKRLTAEMGKGELEARNLVGVLASEGPQSTMREFISERLTEFGAKRQENQARLAALDSEIERLERRQIDADVVRKNLGNFLKLFQKLTEKERVEIVGLLVKRVVYDGENSRVKIALRPLPEAWGDLDHLDGGFYDRQRWLRD
ncbi:MAG TPA: resolvase [Elusimicrobia bacterium]|nr:resolvase [Elusimicrobiota bacterium]HBT60744.1 resolvase [Elusimicrobiota bacterium]